MINSLYKTTGDLNFLTGGLISRDPHFKPKNQLLSFASSYETHTNTIVTLKTSGNKAYCLAKDKSISVYNPDVQNIEFVYGFKSMPTCFAVSANRGVLVAGGDTGTASVSL